MSTLSRFLFDSRTKPSFVELENFTCIEVTGDDAQSFLSNQVTTNIINQKVHSFKSSAIVDEKGRLVTSFIVCKEGECKFILIAKKSFENELLERLNKFLISEDVEFKTSDKDIFISINEFSSNDSLFNGSYCLLPASISFSRPDSDELDDHVHQILKFSAGHVEMGVHAKAGELITNTYLAQSSIDFNKGCYPGQETISKIVNNRGAAFYPVALVGKEALDDSVVQVDSKKIGTIVEKLTIDDTYFHYAFLNRENRIEGKIINVSGVEYKVLNFPLVSDTIDERSEEIFDEAVRLFQTDENEKSKSLLRYLISLNPNYADAYESLGVILGREKKFQEAIEVMKKLAQVDTTSVMAQTNLSMYYMQLGDKETAEKHKAEATFKQFERLGAEAQQKEQLEKQEAQKKADKEKRESMFHQVLEIDPEDALANFGLGELEIERENFNKAAAHLEKAISADSKYSVAYLALSKAQLGLNETELAKETLSKGIEIASKLGDLMPANEMQSILNKL